MEDSTVDQVVEKARKRLALLENEAAQLRAFIHMYQELAGEQSEARSSQSAAESVAEGGAGPANKPAPVAWVPKATPSEIIEASKALMKEKQRPLTRSELVRLLTLRGLKIAGVDKSKNIGTIIWRSKQFENVEGKGYWPLELGSWRDSELNL